MKNNASCNLSVFEEFLKRAENNPTKIMIFDGDKHISYKDAVKIVDYYAELIKKSKNESNRILLKLGHTYRIILIILAIIKLGKSYVPIRNDLSIDEVKKIAEYCNSNLIITDHDKISGLENICIDLNEIDFEEFDDKILETYYRYNADDEVYVLFTSGSTGEPKGCSVTYGNLCYIIRNMINISMCRENDLFAFSTPYTFDVSATEIYSFVYGADICVCDIKKYEDFMEFPSYAEKRKITHMALSPSGFLNMIKTYGSDLGKLFHFLKCVMLAGEAFNKEIYDLWNKNRWTFDLWNLYGPTETTVYATGYKLMKDQEFKTSIPIGRPLAGCNYKIEYLGNENIGELLICGDGVTAGYINNNKEQQKHFIKINEKRYYKTGDLVSEEGNLLYYHGRNDDQIQINGIRVELGEIEYRIAALPYIDRVAVICYKNKIVAFVTIDDGVSTDLNSIRNDLSKALPRYMEPNSIRIIDQIPLNNNNKVDRKKLLEKYLSENVERDSNKNYSSDNLLEKFIRIAEECMDENVNIGCDDDLFECGMDSLSVIRFITDVRNKLDIKIDVDDVYLYRNIRGLLNKFNKKKVCTINEEKTDMSSFLHRLAIFSKKVTDYIYLDGIIKDDYKAIHTQKGYYKNGLKSLITFKFKLENKYNEDDVKTALISLLKDNSILYSRLVEKNGELLFEELKVDENIDIPVWNVQTDDSEIDFFFENYSEEVYKARYHRGILSLFMIVKNSTSYYVVGILDHTIADASNIAIIKNKLSAYINGRMAEAEPKYKDYCQFVASNNSSIDDILDCDYIKKMALAVIKDRENWLDSLSSKTEEIIEYNVKSEPSINTSIHIAFIIASKLIRYTENEYIALRCLVNLREYSEYSFKNTIGDVHVGISFIYKRNMSFELFKEYAFETIDLFTSKGLRPNYVIEECQKYDEEKRMKLTDIIQNGSTTSINYLGEYSEDDYIKLKNDVSSIQSELYTITKDIYVTAVKVEDSLHIFVNKKILP